MMLGLAALGGNMAASRKPFATLTAGDVMSHAVKSIRYDMSLHDAVRILVGERISGLTVVDYHGHVIGVLSATDFVRWLEKAGATVYPPCLPDPDFWAEWREENLARIPKDEVRRHMSVGMVTSPPHALLSTVARQMLDARIHRVIVVDDHDQAIGIVSSTDILAAVAGGVYEPPMKTRS
jgi:CBS-domain-containing membrane protein